MEKRWWNDLEYKEQLEQRLATENWFMLLTVENPNQTVHTPGKVTKIIYAGFKLLLPDGKTTITINPDNPGKNSTLKDIIRDEFDHYSQLWFDQEHQKELVAQEKERLKAEKLAQQNRCEHGVTDQEIRVIQTVKAAGYDEYEESCILCDKVLRTYCMTGYDSDPPDMISDWNWYLRIYRHKYGAGSRDPNPADYRIVETLGSYDPHRVHY